MGSTMKMSPDDYCMLDPTKVTILTPGVDAQGNVAPTGIPAAILTEFLDARRVEIARTGDYTVLVLFSVGTSKGKWGSLLENLFEFKRLYDSEADAGRGAAGAGGTLSASLSQCDVEGSLRRDAWGDAGAAAGGPGGGTRARWIPEQVLTPAQTYQKLLRNETEKIKFSDIAGAHCRRDAGALSAGVLPLSMPGERLGAIDSPVVKLILAYEEFGKRFPGFEREVHGYRGGWAGRLLDAWRD